MNKYYIAGIIFIVLILGSGCVSASDISASDDTTYLEMNVNDEGSSQDSVLSSDQIKVSGDSFDDIQNAIDEISSNGTIELEGQYSSNEKIINVNKPVTIRGSENGATLDAKSLSQVFVINSNVTLKDLTIKNSCKSAIVQYSGDDHELTIINCTFINCSNTAYGGAIYDENEGPLTIINSTFDDNEANFGGAVYSKSGDTQIINSTFTNNRAGMGGAVFFIGNMLAVDKSVFSDNFVVDDEDIGGAIFTNGESSYIRNSRFTGSHAFNGGAIATRGNLNVEYCNFTSDTAKRVGGAIYAQTYMDSDEEYDLKLTVLNSNFNCKAMDNVGNSIYTFGFTVVVKNSKFTSTSNDVYVEMGTLTQNNNTMMNFKVKQILNSILEPEQYSTKYNSGKMFKVKVIDENSNLAFERSIRIVVKSSTLKKEYHTYIDEDYGYALFDLSKLPVGKYKVKIYLSAKYYNANPTNSIITIKKATPVVKAKKVSAKYKKSKKFTVKVKDQKSNLGINKLKIKIKVYTGKKSKSYTVKTNKNGVASINTKKLKRGTHKVIVTSKNKNYDIKKKSSIKIK